MEKSVKCCKFFETIGNSLQSPFLLLIRLIWGYHFFITGLGKLMNLSYITNLFASLDIPFPGFAALVVGIFELLGGISLFFGLYSRIMSVFLIIIMLVAYCTAHAPNITAFSFVTNPADFAKETPFSFLYTSLVIFIFGAGKISLDCWIKNKKEL